MKFAVRSLALITCVALASGGCGGSSDSSAKDKPPASTVSVKPATGDTVTGTGYRYTAPKGWQPPKSPIPGFDPDTIVFDTNDKDGFADNINVLRVSATVSSTDALEKGSKVALQGIHASDIKVLDRQQINGETAIHMTSTLSQNGVDYHTDQFAILRGKFEYAITFSRSGTVSKADEEALAQSVMATWKWAS